MNKITICAVLLCASLSGCNTIGGVGEDIEAVGDGIHRSAEKHKHY